MAKGNMILGYLRGAIGDIVFWRAKGQQMARARNRAPANPRTELQIDVRARWAMLSKFVSIMEPRFLRGAFETKRVNESDYNVFMRTNYNRAQMLSKTAMQNAAYPAPGGPWIMSQGSLSVIKSYLEWEDVQLTSPFFELLQSNTAIVIPAESGRTIAWLSNLLITSAPQTWRVGDVITFVLVSYDLSSDQYGQPTAYPQGTDYQSQFIYRQIVIDTSDTRTISSVLGDYVRVNTIDDGYKFGFSYGSIAETANAYWSLNSRACTFIHSRKTSSGIKVSSSVLVPNDNYALDAAFMSSSAEYKSAVYADWQASETAILQGVGVAPYYDPSDYGNYVIGNKYSASTREVSVGDVTGCSVGDEFSLHVQTDKELTDEQVKYLLGHSILSSGGITVDFNASVQTELAPSGYYGYGLTDQITINRIPAILQFKDETGQVRSVNYTA